MYDFSAIQKGFAETNFGKAYEVIHHFTVDHASKKDLMQNLHRYVSYFVSELYLHKPTKKICSDHHLQVRCVNFPNVMLAHFCCY